MLALEVEDINLGKAAEAQALPVSIGISVDIFVAVEFGVGLVSFRFSQYGNRLHEFDEGEDIRLIATPGVGFR